MRSVALVFDVRSGAAKIGKKKKAVYSKHLYKNLRLDIDWRSGVSESIDFTYLDHGANRDVYAGLSAGGGGGVLKLHPESETSIQKEAALIEQGFGPHVVKCFWAGNLAIRNAGWYVGFLQKKLVTVEKAFEDAAEGSTTAPFAMLFRAVVTLHLDTLKAGFTTPDAGPGNLGMSGGRAVYIDWEHTVPAPMVRKNVNYSLKRMVASAALHMSGNSVLCPVGTELMQLYFNDWWVNLSDSEVAAVFFREKCRGT